MKIKDIKTKVDKMEKYINGWEKMKRASVIIPLVEKDGEINILFEVRSKKLNSQPGDICFPGGKIDEGETPKEAALREINEELGFEDIDIIKEMDILIRHDGLIVHPFLGEVKNLDNIKINKSEVEDVFYVPLSYLLENDPLEFKSKLTIERGEDFPYDLIVGGKDYNFKSGEYDSLFYKYEGYVIWGITASMLKGFIDKIK